MPSASQTLPVVLTIAGTDPSGGAGIQADLKTFTSLGCFGTSVVTALVAQNTTGVQDVHPAPAQFVNKQILSVLEDMQVDALKTGMLFDAEITRTVCASLQTFYSESKSRALPPLIVDPVCVSTSGHTLLDSDATGTVIRDLLPLATIITPNKSEAELLLSWESAERKITSLSEMVESAKALSELGPKATLLKGGHLIVSSRQLEDLLRDRPDIKAFGSGIKERNTEILFEAEKHQKGEPFSSENTDLVVDVLYETQSQKWTIFARRRIDTTSTHGTGCTLSAAITCALGKGSSVVDAVLFATEYTHLAIETAVPLGRGSGPLNHMHGIQQRTIPLITSSTPFPFVRSLIRSTEDIWKDYVEHPFVKQLGEGTLPVESFKHFIKQDYIYLRYYARAYGLLGAKAQSFTTISSAAGIMNNIAEESKMHKAFCESWGITEKELTVGEESSATSAYGGYLLNIGLMGDEQKLRVAFAACLLGYGEVGLWLTAQSKIPGSKIYVQNNPYQRWIDDYAGPRFQEAVRTGIYQLEAQTAADPPSEQRYLELVDVWRTCTRLERNFWNMAMALD
ncbi:hypothetical protein SISNIDRAFT_447652 [Sistotremastrum niveocremeum HHB9708]|uniref:Phosphomethylpyrimidine kinase n=1 Tax=Sistotremastrum niveocremeum HHB9708 TaxID=1314777 RepID=A0A165ADD2_9AGAM|nr:hypothetical protein SISNIDRAFT_447652 [Sistotremastrum niveocremeum HHB9708]